jgi:hypothetical protein
MASSVEGVCSYEICICTFDFVCLGCIGSLRVICCVILPVFVNGFIVEC